MWSNPTVGAARIWAIAADESFSVLFYKSMAADWSATSYLNNPSSTTTSKMAARTLAVLTVKKSGNGAGTISAGAQVCDTTCQELILPYVAGEQADLQVTPTAGSAFVGWQTAEGVPLENIYYANPGDVVYAIFEQQ